MSSPLRFAIVGCGKIASRHATEAARQGQLLAVCDIIKEKADALAQEYHAMAYNAIEDLLKHPGGLDIVAICTPNGLHASHSILALEAGMHVLCEKPLCIHAVDGRSMMEAAKKAGRKLFVVKSTRYNPALAALKEILARQQLGRLYSFQLNCFWNRPEAYYHDSWKGSLLADGGSLYTQFSHYIDALLWLLGDVENLRGYRKNMAHRGVIEFEDSGVVALEMKNGMLGGLHWSLNTYKKNMEVSLSIIAEKGSLRIGGEYMNKVEYQCTENASLEIPDRGIANEYGFYKGSMSNHDKVYENLVRALHDDNHPFTQAAEGLKTVETIEKIYQSIALQ
ncbi:MAG TPA: Gfo/Idh/MocA family oxidoreductase [Chitinophagaceae bacterium]|nr:Gfo/Idh/MocA family oxidoreductase [Chitinophagaceae bacterium]